MNETLGIFESDSQTGRVVQHLVRLNILRRLVQREKNRQRLAVPGPDNNQTGFHVYRLVLIF